MTKFALKLTKFVLKLMDLLYLLPGTDHLLRTVCDDVVHCRDVYRLLAVPALAFPGGSRSEEATADSRGPCGATFTLKMIKNDG